MTTKEKLISLYNEMSEMTLQECKSCRVPLSCCSSEYCQISKDYAKEVYGVELKPLEDTDRLENLPFLSAKGCIVPPHLRPLCTIHTCSINSLGFKKNDLEWTDKYFKLRAKIETLETKLNRGTRRA